MSFIAVTDAIRIIASPAPLPERSDPSERRYAFAYRIRIENNGEAMVKLLSRRWTITAANGVAEEVEGEGVVGLQPVIPPAGAFEYTSGALISAPSGMMSGVYVMAEIPSGRTFEAVIPTFLLETAAPSGFAN